MRLTAIRPVFTLLLLTVPAAVVAASPSGVVQSASVAAVAVSLAVLGWGFHAMLRHRLAAEDRLAELESAVALERDAHLAAQHHARQRAAIVEAEWQRLAACLTTGDRSHVPERMHAVHAAIVSLHEPA